MTFILDFFGNLFGIVINFLCELCGNQYWLGIFVFTLLVNLLLLPLNIKQQQSTASQARMKNKLARIKEKCGDDRQKYQEEMSKVYSEGGSSPLSGCLLLFIRLPIFFAIYNAIQRPLESFYGASKELIEKAIELVNSGVIEGVEIKQTHLAQHSLIENIDKIVAYDPQYAALTDGGHLDFTLFGLNLFDKPEFGHIDWIWIIPLISFATSMLMSVYSTINNKKTNPDAAGGPAMGCMMFGMPIFSLVLTFAYPGAVGWYWACSNIVSTIISVCMTKFFAPGKLIAQLEAKEAKKRRAYEQSIINPQAKPTKKSLLKK